MGELALEEEIIQRREQVIKNKDITGLVIKGIGGFYYVEVHDNIYQCRVRGIFRKNSFKPMVGDRVNIQIKKEDKTKGVIVDFLPRKNQFVRPSVCNVEQCILVSSYKDPIFNSLTIDRQIIVAGHKQTDIIICITKADLISPEARNKIESIYRGTGYKIIALSAKNNEGVDELKEALKGKINVLIGPSGVGKSTIINKLQEDVQLKTGVISEKSKAGKHTTRHVEIFSLDSNTDIFDTPGFTSYKVLDLKKEQIKDFYIEFGREKDRCRFTNCNHIEEEDCNIKLQVIKGNINKNRYKNYKKIYEEIEREKNYD